MYKRGPRSQEVGEEGDSIKRYTVTTRTTLAFRWAAMAAVWINYDGQVNSQDSVNRPQVLKTERRRRAEVESNRSLSYRKTEPALLLTPAVSLASLLFFPRKREHATFVPNTEKGVAGDRRPMILVGVLFA